jgi:hypothetical protein
MVLFVYMRMSTGADPGFLNRGPRITDGTHSWEGGGRYIDVNRGGGGGGRTPDCGQLISLLFNVIVFTWLPIGGPETGLPPPQSAYGQYKKPTCKTTL